MAPSVPAGPVGPVGPVTPGVPGDPWHQWDRYHRSRQVCLGHLEIPWVPWLPHLVARGDQGCRATRWDRSLLPVLSIPSPLATPAIPSRQWARAVRHHRSPQWGQLPRATRAHLGHQSLRSRRWVPVARDSGMGPGWPGHRSVPWGQSRPSGQLGRSDPCPHRQGRSVPADRLDRLGRAHRHQDPEDPGDPGDQEGPPDRRDRRLHRYRRRRAEDARDIDAGDDAELLFLFLVFFFSSARFFLLLFLFLLLPFPLPPLSAAADAPSPRLASRANPAAPSEPRTSRQAPVLARLRSDAANLASSSLIAPKARANTGRAASPNPISLGVKPSPSPHEQGGTHRYSYVPGTRDSLRHDPGSVNCMVNMNCCSWSNLETLHESSRPHVEITFAA